MDTPATSWKCPASSPLNTEAHQPTTSVGSISPPCTQPLSPTENEVMLYSIMWHWKGGRNCERKCCIPLFYKPPPPPPLRFVLSLMLPKGLWLLIFMRDMFFTFSMSQALFSEIKTENFFCCPRQVITFQSNKTLPILIAIWLKPTGKLIKH